MGFCGVLIGGERERKEPRIGQKRKGNSYRTTSEGRNADEAEKDLLVRLEMRQASDTSVERGGKKKRGRENRKNKRKPTRRCHYKSIFRAKKEDMADLLHPTQNTRPRRLRHVRRACGRVLCRGRCRKFEVRCIVTPCTSDGRSQGGEEPICCLFYSLFSSSPFPLYLVGFLQPVLATSSLFDLNCLPNVSTQLSRAENLF